ncbi:MAG: stage II sporulation protein M [Candidatus Nanoarchaeia archaeon]
MIKEQENKAEFLIGLKQFIGSTKAYFVFASLLFLFFILLGFLFPIFFNEEILELMSGLVEKTEGLGFFGLWKYIFLNNLKSSFFAFVLGVGFSIFPIFVLVINGYVLGFVMNQVASYSSILQLWRILPHGVFEIPAILISIGLGIKLGSYLFVKHEKNEFLKWILYSGFIFLVFVVLLLVVAALIESFLIVFLK